jgi:hypothetical protein
MNLIPTYNETKEALVYTWGMIYLFMQFNMKHVGVYVSDFKETFLQNPSTQVYTSTQVDSSTQVDTTPKEKEFNHSEDSAFESVKQSNS